MRDAEEVGGFRLRGRGVEAAVDLERVATDDLAVERLRQQDRDLGFSRPGGSRDDEEARTQRVPRPRSIPRSRDWSRSSSIVSFMWS